MVAKRHFEFKAVVDAVFVYFANVIVHAGCTEDWSSNSGVDGKITRQLADALRARHKNLVVSEETFELVDKLREFIHDFLRLLKPARRQITPATTKTHVVAHHSRTGE